MTRPAARQLVLLSDEEFKALTTEEKIAYLQMAAEARALINRHFETMLDQFVPVRPKDSRS
jgi:hypothetical protein